MSDFSRQHTPGLANELSPHYFNQAKLYIGANPDTRVGRPGRHQVRGSPVTVLSSSGVQHRSGALPPAADAEKWGVWGGGEEWWQRAVHPTHQVEVARMRQLSHGKYLVAGTVGDQDWLTILGWESPHLFHLLPCTFNVQTHEVAPHHRTTS